MHTPVRTRMAPSPTGELHVGSLAILLKNYAFARKHGGSFVLRIEDTDQKREVPGAIQRIYDVTRAYGLDWDEGPDKGGPYAPYTQSERLDRYKEATQQLIDSGHAYYCFCSEERLDRVKQEMMAKKKPPMYDKHCQSIAIDDAQRRVATQEPYVIRLKVPENQTITFTDWIRGDISVDSNTINDQVLLKSDGFPTYHLAVVVDDNDMRISHVFRGEEWISSTPKHVLLYQAFGWDMPIFAHFPVFLNPDGKGKMSKRKGDVSAQSFLDKGYLPQALLNFFMILGWTPKDQREIITLDEYIKEFDPREISQKSVVFDLKKLDWLNGMYIRSLSIQELSTVVTPFLPADFPDERLTDILPLVHERLVTLSDIEELTSFFYRPIAVEADFLAKPTEESLVVQQLEQTKQKLSNLGTWSLDQIEQTVRSLQETNNWKKSQYFMLLRKALTGQTQTPPLFETIQVLGSSTTLSRLDQALKKLST